MPCNHLRDLLKEEKIIIERHFGEFMNRKHVGDGNEAKKQFIKEYGWIMREMYCDLCPDKKNCDAYEETKKGNSIPK